ncbi:Ig-like domain-containing protein [Flavobacteriaceae bacterium]|nr:Ig-like domain-containing protein [Flavobacteriaceae bacterium]
MCIFSTNYISWILGLLLMSLLLQSHKLLNANYLYFDDNTVAPGDVFELVINLHLEEPSRGFQFDIEIPNEFNLEFAGVTADAILNNFSVSSSDLGNGQYRFIVFSLANDILNAGDFPVFYLPVETDVNAPAGVYSFPMTGVTISGLNNQNIATAPAVVGEITIQGNEAPVALNQNVSLEEDTSIAIILEATDPEGDPLTYTIVDQPTNGTAVLTGNTVDYAPDVDYNGPDSFTFKANDGTTDSNTATVSINVTPVNDAPVASDQSVSTDEDTMIQITLVATDIDGDPLTYTIVDQPTNGTAVLTGNTVDYTPDGNYNGPDSFTFKVNDGTTDSNTATVSIDVLLFTEDIDRPNFKAFPNPFIKIINLKARETGTIFIHSVSGNLIAQFPYYSGENLNIRMEKYPSGLFFVTFITQGNSETLKLIKL